MNKNEVIEIVREFEGSLLTKFEFENSQIKLAMEKEGRGKVTEGFAKESAEGIRESLNDTKEKSTQTNLDVESDNTKNENLIEVKAPLVGTFYSAPSPDEEPYVKEGEQVDEGQVLCLVEAMKMMNELKAPVRGIVRSVKGINGQLVEFGQVLFEVEPC